jgi:hypothetical protein
VGPSDAGQDPGFSEPSQRLEKLQGCVRFLSVVSVILENRGCVVGTVALGAKVRGKGSMYNSGAFKRSSPFLQVTRISNQRQVDANS